MSPPESAKNDYEISSFPSNKTENKLIQLNQVTKKYREGGQDLQILDQADLEIEGGKFLAILGKSGSGKTTLLNLLSGIDQVDSGDIYYQTTNFSRLNDQQKTIYRRQNIGFVFQFFNLIPTLTVWENVVLPLNLNGKTGKDDFKHAEDLLKEVGLIERKKTYPDRLSGGEQQRIALVRALVHDPLLILADEPTGNLDEATGKKVLDLLQELTHQLDKTLVMVTHSPQAAGRADCIVYLKKGKFIDKNGSIEL